MTRHLTLLVAVVGFGSAIRAEEPKADAADKAITRAVADLKANLDKTKDEAERRKLSAAVAQLEALAKKSPKTDNHLLLDFADNQKNYVGKTLTFKMHVPTKAGAALNELGSGDLEFFAQVGEDLTTVKVRVYCESKILSGGPAVQPGDPVIVTIKCGTATENSLVAVKRP